MAFENAFLIRICSQSKKLNNITRIYWNFVSFWPTPSELPIVDKPLIFRIQFNWRNCSGRKVGPEQCCSFLSIRKSVSVTCRSDVIVFRVGRSTVVVGVNEEYWYIWRYMAKLVLTGTNRIHGISARNYANYANKTIMQLMSIKCALADLNLKFSILVPAPMPLY